jgi:hypothetical protein
MPNIINLTEGEVYFLVGFYDPDLTIPSIGTYLYEGSDSIDGIQHHLFISARGSVDNSEEVEEFEPHHICFELGKINGVLDKKHLLEWLSEEHSPKTVGRTYEYCFK